MCSSIQTPGNQAEFRARVDTSLINLAQTSFSLPKVFEPSHEFINSSVGRIHTIVWGKDNLNNPGSPVLLCLHGASRSAYDFSVVAQLLADKFCVIAMDYAGHGETSWEYNQSTSFVRRQIQAVVDEFPTDNLHLFGMSLGGLHCAHYAGNILTVKRVILGDITPELEKGKLDKISDSLGLSMTGDLDRKKVCDNTVKTGRTEIAKKQLKLILKLSKHGVLPVDFEPTLSEFITDKNFKSFWGAIEKIRCPTLLLKGGEDTYVLPKSEKRMEKRVQSAEIKSVPSGGHNFVLDNPCDTANLIRDFLFASA
jgi:pimeloyl-ACP methyl ester carboxylesterase